MRVSVESANKLTDSQKQALVASLNGIFGEETSIEFSVDSGLIGGLRLVTDSKVVDFTLKARLNQLAQNLQS